MILLIVYKCWENIWLVLLKHEMADMGWHQYYLRLCQQWRIILDLCGPSLSCLLLSVSLQATCLFVNSEATYHSPDLPVMDMGGALYRDMGCDYQYDLEICCREFHQFFPSGLQYTPFLCLSLTPWLVKASLSSVESFQ